jgi:hypothetical protein
VNLRLPSMYNAVSTDILTVIIYICLSLCFKRENKESGFNRQSDLSQDFPQRSSYSSPSASSHFDVEVILEGTLRGNVGEGQTKKTKVAVCRGRG